jgi:hypothetical protein
MRGTVTDKERAKALEAKLMPAMFAMRPDVIGAVRGWDGDTFTTFTYFTSEAEARAGEQKVPDSGSAEQAVVEEMMSLVGDLTYADLKDPILRSA